MHSSPASVARRNARSPRDHGSGARFRGDGAAGPWRRWASKIGPRRARRCCDLQCCAARRRLRWRIDGRRGGVDDLPQPCPRDRRPAPSPWLNAPAGSCARHASPHGTPKRTHAWHTRRTARWAKAPRGSQRGGIALTPRGQGAGGGGRGLCSDTAAMSARPRPADLLPRSVQDLGLVRSH